MSRSDRNTESAAWAGYWTRAQGQQADYGRALTSADQASVLKKLWHSFFRNHVSACGQYGRLVDLGCGAGEVLQIALESNEIRNEWDIIGVDYAPSAVLRAAGIGRNVYGIAADVSGLPIAPGVVDLAVSQFGIEYAGRDAFKVVPGVLRVNGAFMAIVHARDGAIYNECLENATITDRLLASDVAELASQFFVEGSDCSPAKAKEIEERLVKLQDLQNTSAPASQVMRHFSDTVRRFVQRPQAFSHSEVRAWLNGFSSELSAYYARMSAMTRSALSEQDMRNIADMFKGAGLSVVACEPLLLGEPKALAAWRIEAKRIG